MQSQSKKSTTQSPHFLAKSDGETITDHTNNLFKQLNLLKSIYPEAIQSSKLFKLIHLAAAYHDLGKINNKFQDRMKSNTHLPLGQRLPDIHEYYHNYLSVALINYQFLQQQGFNENEIKALYNAVGYHHHRQKDTQFYNDQTYQQAINNLKNPANQFDFTKVGLPKDTKPTIPLSDYFKLQEPLTLPEHYPNQEFLDDAMFVLGFLNRADFAASGHYQIEVGPRVQLNKNILPALSKRLSDSKKTPIQAHFNNLQSWAADHTDQDCIVIAQTGIGKTEAAINWSDSSKTLFLLPLRSASYPIFTRLHDEYQITNSTLLDSDTAETLQNRVSDRNTYRQALNQSRQLSYQATVATVDQLVPSVFHYQGYEPKMVTSAYSHIILDEIQMYDARLLAYTIAYIQEAQKYGAKIFIMTATLAPFVKDILVKKLHIKSDNLPTPFLNHKLLHRHNIKVKDTGINSTDILQHYQKAHDKTLAICNTVKQARKLTQDLLNNPNINNNEIHLLHSRFIHQERAEKEHAIVNFTKSNNHQSGIWISTQIVEASLDIDFDMLFTELSDLTGLFQRMGRCYRQRNTTKDHTNVVIYTAGENSLYTSGIKSNNHSVVDIDLFKLAKQALLNTPDGLLTEQDKLDLIDQTYTTDKVRFTNFYRVFKQELRNIKALQSQYITKADAQYKFREIISITAIPEVIYHENQNDIDHAQQILDQTGHTSQEYRDARKIIKDLSIDVPGWIAYQNGGSMLKQISNDVIILSDKIKYDDQLGLDSKISN